MPICGNWLIFVERLSQWNIFLITTLLLWKSPTNINKIELFVANNLHKTSHKSYVPNKLVLF